MRRAARAADVVVATIHWGVERLAYSLGNFVFSAGSPGTTRTGILKLRLSTRGVEGVHFLRAWIDGTRPVLLGRGRGA